MYDRVRAALAALRGRPVIAGVNFSAPVHIENSDRCVILGNSISKGDSLSGLYVSNSVDVQINSNIIKP